MDFDGLMEDNLDMVMFKFMYDHEETLRNPQNGEIDVSAHPEICEEVKKKFGIDLIEWQRQKGVKKAEEGCNSNTVPCGEDILSARI